MIDLTFVGNGNALSGPFHNDIGYIPYGVSGWFDYYTFTPGHTVPPSISVLDGLYNSSAQLIGNVLVSDSTQTNGTVGMFSFHPELFIGPHPFDEVYVSNVGLYSDGPIHPGSAVPEASTWVMCLMGLALLAYAAMRRPKSLEVRASPCRLRSELLGG